MSERGHYTLEHGSYYWWPPRDPLSHTKLEPTPRVMVDRVTIGYTMSKDGSVVVHKHGEKHHVETWASRSRKQYIEAGFPQVAEEVFVLTFPPRYDVDKINRCLDTVGYLGMLIDANPMLTLA